MSWYELKSFDTLEKPEFFAQNSFTIIFKHSTRFPISSLAKSRVESVQTKFPQVNFVYLDLLKYRDISNKIAEKFEVEHQSPQILVINKNGNCIYHCSHTSISESIIIQAIS